MIRGVLIMCLFIAIDAAGGDERIMCSGPSLDADRREQMSSLIPLQTYAFKFKSQNSKDHNYDYTLHICNHQDKTVVLQEDPSKPNSPPITIGRHNETRVIKGVDWMQLEFRGGDRYPEDDECAAFRRTAVIMIKCSNSLHGKVYDVLDSRGKSEENCYYLFELETNLVCQSTGGDSSRGGGHSILWLLVLLLLIGVLAYLSIGIMYNRHVHDAKGWQQLPNADFWSSVGSKIGYQCEQLRDRLSSSSSPSVSADRGGLFSSRTAAASSRPNNYTHLHTPVPCDFDPEENPFENPPKPNDERLLAI